MPAPIDWITIEKWMMLNDDFPGASKEFGVKENTIRQRASRQCWPLPSVIAKVAAKKLSRRSENGELTEKTAEILASEVQEHKSHVFKLAKDSLAKLKKLPVRNAKDADIVDRMARRSAGLENDTPMQVALIQMHEAMENRDSTVIEAEIVSEASEPAALPA